MNTPCTTNGLQSICLKCGQPFAKESPDSCPVCGGVEFWLHYTPDPVYILPSFDSPVKESEMKRIPLNPTAGLAVLLEHLIQRDPGRILAAPTPERVGTELGTESGTKAPNPEALASAQAKRLRKQGKRIRSEQLVILR